VDVGMNDNDNNDDNDNDEDFLCKSSCNYENDVPLYKVLSQQKPAAISDNLEPIECLFNKRHSFVSMKPFETFYTWFTSHFVKLNMISHNNFIDKEAAEPKQLTQ
jgi:hypothetical protein